MNTFFYRHNKSTEKPAAIKDNVIQFNELTFVLKGKLSYRVDDKEIAVSANNCIYIKSGSVRERETADLTDYVSFNFRQELSFDESLGITDCLSTEIKLLISICDEIYDKYYEWSDKIDDALNLIVKLLSDKLLTNEENPIAVKIKRFVRKNISERLSLEQIAQSVGYTPNYCDAIFKKFTDFSIMDFVIQEKISEAKRLLAEGVYSLKQTAEAVGYYDYNYFARIFKNRCGYTPTEYKSKLFSK